MTSNKYCESVVKTFSSNSIVSLFGALDRVYTTKDPQLYNISGMSRLKSIHIGNVTAVGLSNPSVSTFIT